jgi:thymidylate synthase (FAD)
VAIDEVLKLSIPCLDGFVRLVDVMGDDSSIVQAARVSYGEGTKKIHEDRGLIRYLIRHQHWTPVEMVEFKFHVKLPVFIARQWIRHRTANVNEISARYSEMKDEIYLPPIEHISSQSNDNKQGRNSEPFAKEQAQEIQDLIMQSNENQYKIYQNLLDRGVARELARTVLPVGHYTEWYWKIDLRNLMNFLALRLDPHAQWEIRVYAEAMSSLVKQIVPIAWEAFEDYILNSVNFSKDEIEVIKEIINSTSFNIEDLSKEKGLKGRELVEFLSKLNHKHE